MTSHTCDQRPPSALQETSFLVVDGDRQHARTLIRTLRTLSARVEHRPELGTNLDVRATSAHDFIVANTGSLPLDQLRRIAALDRPTGPFVLFTSNGSNQGIVPDLFRGRHLTHLMARTNEPQDATGLIVTVRKILEGDIFGIEKYFVWGIEPVTRIISGSADKESILRDLDGYAGAIGINQRLATHVVGVADELISNAVYNAPRNELGQPSYAHYSRDVPVALEINQRPEIRYCCDGVRLGISVTDPFGSLAVETILDYMSKCFRAEQDQIDEKHGGAGLGLYEVFNWVSSFIINIEPGVRTEFIGIIDISGSYRNFAEGTKSFNIFRKQKR